jgi:hypothetical protein
MKVIKKSHLKQLGIVLSSGVLVLLCSSCGWFVGDIADDEITELHKNMKATTRTTIFTPSLNQLGKLLNAYYIQTTPVQSKNIGNKTGAKNLPTDLYAMTAAAINKIGRPLIFVPYDAQYVISESSTGGTITRLYPKIVLAGGITGFDKAMFDKEREMEASGGWAGAQAGGHVKASGNYSRITFDLNALDYKTQSYLPQVIASNSIALKKDSLGWGVHGYYMGNGASFDYDLKRKQGIHAALRNLVEFSIIEVIGKCFKVPYWRTIKGALPDKQMISRIANDFSEKNKVQQALIIKKLLFLHGFNGIDRHNYIFKSNEDEALKSAMRQYSAKNMNELYIKLWLNVPIKVAARRVAIDRRRLANIAREQTAKRQKLAAREQQREQLLKQKQLKARQLKIASYNSYITQGDRLFKIKEYLKARQNYLAANRLFGGEAYPKQMIRTINAIYAKQQAVKTKYNNSLKIADQLYQQAEKNSFNYKKYRQVLERYQQTLVLAPNNNHVQQQIKKIKLKMRKYSTVLQDKGEW